MTQFSNLKRSALAVAIASVLTTAPVVAQTNETSDASGARMLDEVVITARKKSESLEDVPLAVSALTASQLERAGIDSFDQVLQTVPNASQAGGIGGGLQGLVSIRGISTLVRFVGLETGVGFYVDGVYVGRPENFNQDLIDIERIEVLRGPQGAVFGKNTIAGAINIITRNPSDELSGQAELKAGNFGHLRARGYVAGAISDAVAVSLAGGYVSRDGYTENTSGTGPDLDDADLLTARAKLRADIGNTELVVSADVLRDRGKPSFFEVTDVAFLDDPSESTPFTVNQDQPNFLDRDINGISLTATTDFGGPTWTNVVGYRDSSFDAGLDDDKLPVRYFVDFFSSDTEFVSLESRIAHSLGDRVDYMIGVYYFDQQADNISNFALGDFLTGVPGVEPPIDLTSSVDTESIAIFFNTDWALTDQLSLEVGGRYVTEDKTATHVQDDQTGIFGSTDFSADRSDTDFSPTVSLSYAFADGLTGYLRYAEGFKSAGFNTDFVTATSNLEVEPEEATALEAGLKARLGDAARLNLALFTTDYENLQLSQIVGGGVSLNNAAEATINGIEADIVIAAGDYFDINASLGYLDATYDEFTGCPVPGAALPGTTQADCSGNMLNLAPEWSANLGVQWTYPMSAGGNLIARADWSYRSEVFFEPQNTDRLSGDDRSLLDVRVGYATETWEVFAWARNATDEVYENFADDRSAIFVNTTTAYGPPRMYGVTARMRFGNGN